MPLLGRVEAGQQGWQTAQASPGLTRSAGGPLPGSFAVQGAPSRPLVGGVLGVGGQGLAGSDEVSP